MLIEINTMQGPFWVNPEHVTRIYQGGGHTQIEFSNGSIVSANGHIDDVVRIMSRASQPRSSQPSLIADAPSPDLSKTPTRSGQFLIEPDPANDPPAPPEIHAGEDVEVHGMFGSAVFTGTVEPVGPDDAPPES